MRSFSLRPRRPSPALVVAVIACVIATTGVAVSAPFGPDGTIHACYDAEQYADGGSTMVIVPNAKSCATGDYPDHFTFNARGVPGAPGAPGPQGIGGPPGQSGIVPPKIKPADTDKLVKQMELTQSRIDKNGDKLEVIKDKLEDGKNRSVTERQIEQIIELLRPMIAALLKAQQQQMDQLGQIHGSIGFQQSIGSAKDKLKEAEDASKAAEKAEKQLDTGRATQDEMNRMMESIVRFMREMQEAQNEQMRALMRL